MLSRSSRLFTPDEFLDDFCLLPAAVMRVGVEISVGIDDCCYRAPRFFSSSTTSQ
jgi:hypothetical protein